MFRHLHFVNVNRARAAADADERVADVKVKGRIKLLPTNWDDIPVGSIRDRNWKRDRKTQYRTVNM